LLTAHCSLFTLLSCLLLSGCVRRTLAIRSQPPGAQVLLNGEPLGSTPYERELEWYGWYHVTLIKPGFERIDDHVEIRAPLQMWIPLDLAMELLPFRINDPNVLAYRLVPQAAPVDPIPAEIRARARQSLSIPVDGEPPQPPPNNSTQ